MKKYEYKQISSSPQPMSTMGTNMEKETRLKNNNNYEEK